MNKPPIVALRSNEVCFYGILRSAAAAGIDVVPVIFDWPGAGPWLSESSRWFHDPVTIANPPDDEQGAVAGLIALGRELCERYGDRPLLLPSSDTNLMLMMRHGADLAHNFKLQGGVDFATPRYDLVRKDEVATLLSSAGVAAPRTVAVASASDIERACAQMTYPCIYKPTIKDYRHTFQNTHAKLKAVECDSESELRQRLATEVARGYELIVQEKIVHADPEDEISIYVYADESSSVCMATSSHKSRQHPQRYGTGLVIHPRWCDETHAIAESVAAAVSFRGMMEIELMRDAADGFRWKVIEVNPRPWLLHHFNTMLGFNFIDMLYRDATDGLEEGAPLCARVTKPAAFMDVLAVLAADAKLRDQLAEFFEGLGGEVSFAMIDAADREVAGRVLTEVATRYGQECRRVIEARAFR